MQLGFKKTIDLNGETMTTKSYRFDGDDKPYAVIATSSECRRVYSESFETEAEAVTFMENLHSPCFKLHTLEE